MRVIGIDPSTKTGIAILDGEGNQLQTRVVTFPNKSGLERVELIAGAVGSLLDQYAPTFAVIEGYAYGNTNTLVGLVEIGTMIRMELRRRQILFKVIQPSALKKFTTGKGHAKKEAMGIAVKERWGFASDSDDVVDAYALARFGLHQRGTP